MAYFAIINAKGELVSEGSVVDDRLQDRGLTAIPVDGPSNGRLWDATAKAWGNVSVVVASPLARARTLYVAANTDTQRLDALATALGLKP